MQVDNYCIDCSHKGRYSEVGESCKCDECLITQGKRVVLGIVERRLLHAKEQRQRAVDQGAQDLMRYDWSSKVEALADTVTAIKANIST